MAAAIRFFALLALCLTPVLSKRYVWAGGNMDFFNTDNWQSGLAPNSTNLPCTTTFGSPGAIIISNLGARVYNVGSTLYLPPEGTLYLANDGTIIFFNPDADTCSGDFVWTGGLVQEQRNDIYCHANWVVDAGSLGLRPATETPCADDTLVFNSGSSYHAYIKPSVALFAVDTVNIGSTISIDSNAERSLGLPQVNLFSNTGVVYIGNNALTDVCIPNNRYDANSLKCICDSSCPTQAMQDAIDARLRAGILSLANQTLTAMNSYHTVTFRGIMNAASLLMQPNQLNTAMRNPSDPTNTLIANAVTTALLDLPAATVTSVTVTLSADNTTVTVAGTLNATAGSIFPIGFSSLSPPGNILWSSTTSAIPSNVTRTQIITQATLTSQLFSTLATLLSQQTTQQTNAQSTTVQNALALIKAAPNPLNATAALSQDTCLATCGQSCTACIQGLESALVANALYSTTLASQLTAQLAALAGPTYPDSLATINNIISTFVAAQAANTAATQNALQVYTLDSPTIYIGRLASQTNQLRAIASQNYANVIQALSQAISGFQGIGAITNMQMQYVDPVPSASTNTVLRRAVSESASGLSVTFTYNITCSPSDTACHTAFTPSGSAGTNVQQRLDNTFNLLTFSSGQCYSGGTPDATCLSAVAAATCATSLGDGKTSSAARQDAYSAVFNLTECGGSPRFPNGTCLNPNPYAAAYSTSLTQASALTCGAEPTTAPPTTGPGGTGIGGASAASSSSGSSIVPIAAAAGGGGLLLIVVVILLLRRKRSVPQTKKSTDDRTVVAFENPMYDDPAQSTAQPVYDAAHQDGEGLYDEPAFNQSSVKQNPVYQSTENLAEAAGIGTDGYLDVSPGTVPGAVAGAEDVGYLQNASAGAEDVGYLEK